MNSPFSISRACSLLILLVFFCACSDDTPTVVVYTSLDELYARPILDAFELKSGIKVLAQYDSEAAKTTGLVQRLLSEKARPRADVFWNNEVVQTLSLEQAGMLEAYSSPSAKGIPDQFRDAEGYWTGFAARARVLIWNTDMVTVPPTTIDDLLKPEWRGKIAIANPLFGTTATHAAALFSLWGEDRARAFFDGLKKNKVAILPGNGAVRDLVARGEYAIGLTDTDDANGGVEDGFPVAWALAEHGGEGVLLIPNSVALIKGAPHPERAKALIDYLLSEDVERALANSRSIQIPLRAGVETPPPVPELATIHLLPVDFEKAAAVLQASAEYIQSEFLK